MANLGFNQAFSFSQSCGFGNGFSSGVQNPYTAGIRNDRYAGYFNDDMSWFESRIPTVTTYPISIIQDPSSDDGSNFSRRWTGYFRPQTSETYTFYLSSDDASYLWLGAAALSGWSAANAVVDNGGLHGVTEKSGVVSLNAGVLYPIRVLFGEQDGGDVLTFSWSTPSQSKTTNLAGLIFYNPAGVNIGF